MKENPTIAIIGLGYVGLPLAVAFAEKYKVIGFDINTKRVNELNEGNDFTLEVSTEELGVVLNNTSENSKLIITDNPSEIAQASIYIVTVPTPTNKYNQ
ncbi:MAG: nucleotide sugar dehydrogenase, partial [Flavobacteriaceae bacterium]|nr:nucleotide sugar dehydrogenase [Flavobacteriaceae bacterium]